MSTAAALKKLAGLIEKLKADLSPQGARKTGERFLQYAEDPSTFQRGAATRSTGRDSRTSSA